MALREYRKKRDFAKTAEPRGRSAASAKRKPAKKKAGAKKKTARKGAPQRRRRIFVVQEHWATRHHFDVRLELNGTLKSWAVPKGPSKDPADKRLAVHVEDHPIEYAKFEGQIPEGEYGAGKVRIFDSGTWEPLGDAPPRNAYGSGKLHFELKGKKLKGGWKLVRIRSREGEKADNWLLIKERDRHARPR